MERLYAHVSTRQAALQQRPEVLQAVRVYAAIHILNCMVNDLVLVFFVETFIAAHLVSEQCRASLDVLFHDWLQGVLQPIWDDLSANATATLQDSHDYSLVSETLTRASDAALVNTLVHVASFATDEGLVRFDFAAQFASEEFILYCKPNAMEHEPCGLLTYLHVTGNLVTANSILAVGDEPPGS